MYKCKIRQNYEKSMTIHKSMMINPFLFLGARMFLVFFTSASFPARSTGQSMIYEKTIRKPRDENPFWTKTSCLFFLRFFVNTLSLSLSLSLGRMKHMKQMKHMKHVDVSYRNFSRNIISTCMSQYVLNELEVPFQLPDHWFMLTWLRYHNRALWDIFVAMSFLTSSHPLASFSSQQKRKKHDTLKSWCRLKGPFFGLGETRKRNSKKLHHRRPQTVASCTNRT